jgi:hypothetical protein
LDNGQSANCELRAYNGSRPPHARNTRAQGVTSTLAAIGNLTDRSDLFAVKMQPVGQEQLTSASNGTFKLQKQRESLRIHFRRLNNKPTMPTVGADVAKW